MKLVICGTTYELKFGISFINAIDNMYKQNVHGVEFGLGIELLNTQLEMGRPTALFNAIKAGTSHLDSKPSNHDVESYLEGLALSDGDDYENLFDGLKESMEQAPFLKRALNQMKKNAQ